MIRTRPRHTNANDTRIGRPNGSPKSHQPKITPKTGATRHWNDEDRPPALFVTLGEGWSPRSVLVTGTQPADRAVSDERRTFELEATAGEGAVATAEAALVYGACDDDGTCRILKRVLTIPLRR